MRACPRCPTTPPTSALGPATRLLWRSARTPSTSSSAAGGGRGRPRSGGHPRGRRPVAPARRTVRRAVPARPDLARRGGLPVAAARTARPTTRLAPPVPRLAGELTALAARHGERRGGAAQRPPALRGRGVRRRAGRRRRSRPSSPRPASGGCTVPRRVRRSCGTALRAASPRPTRVPSSRSPPTPRCAGPHPTPTPRPLPVGEPPDLTVLAVDAPVDSEQLRGPARRGRGAPRGPASGSTTASSGRSCSPG